MNKQVYVLMLLVVLGGCAKPQVIGGQKDEFGCLTGAGYSWDNDISACTRSWEIKGDLATAAKIVVMPMSARPVTIVSVDALECNGCYNVTIRVGDSITSVRLVNWTANYCGECPQLVPPAPGFCSDGTLVPGAVNSCGCQAPPSCSTQIANPASKFCAEQGGTLKMVQTPEGTQGICVLAGGLECDEWAYFRGECPKHICTAQEKQAEICTMDYSPVCGDNGVTYGNACSGCASKKIASWVRGECQA